MIGKAIKFKIPLESKSLIDAYDIVQLTEPHEAGEIINNDWLIINSDYEEFMGKYKAGYYVRVVNLRFCDIIETDINYDNRDDLRKINIKPLSNVNVYEVH